MRPLDEIKCEIPRCTKVITEDDPPFVAGTGICNLHSACVKCHAIGTMSDHKKSMDRQAYAKCKACGHYFPLHQYVDVILPYWSSLMGVLHRHDFDWHSGSIIGETSQDTPPCWLTFTPEWSDVWGSTVPTKANPRIDQVGENVDIDWIAQDKDYLYAPYVHEGNVKVKKYLRDVRRYVPGFIVLPVVEVTVDINSEGYLEQRALFNSLGVDGRKR